MKCLLTYLLIMTLAACVAEDTNRFTGFWEGPHPVNPESKFYVELVCENDSFLGRAFWAENRHYQSTFKIDSVRIAGDSMCFFVPAWGCTYTGGLSDKGVIRGGFFCEGEAFDTVILVKDQEIENHLIYSKPGCNDPDFSYAYVIPAEGDDLLEPSAYTTAGDSLFIHSLLPEIIQGEYGRINSFLLYRSDKLICEEYFYGFTRDDLHQIESCTKSVTSLLVGIAVDQAYITNLGEALYSIFPEYPVLGKAGYRDLNIEDLLTMKSGYDLLDKALFSLEHFIDTALVRPLSNPPGKVFQYDGANTEILGVVLKKKTGMFADEFARKYLFEPLHIERYNWDGPGQNGYPLMCGSLSLTPRSMVKIGAMVLNHGRFNEQEVLSESWIEESTSVKTETNFPGDKYSYQWWNLHLDSGGKAYKTIWANGWGSQFIFIIPELDAVIVTTGFNYENDSWAIREGISKYLHYLD